MRRWSLFGKIVGLVVVVCMASYWILFASRDSGTTPIEKAPFQVLWTFEPPDRGAIISSPLVDEEKLFVAAIHDTAFNSRGAVYCLDRKTRKVLWKFNDDGTMQHMYSSPCLAEGRLYIGEGMHANFVCKLYCLDVRTGKKLWHFETAGHIESSPCVAGGLVYFGSGDDGLYCLDAETGHKRWHFHPPAHIDSSPIVVGGRLYAGSGVSRSHTATEIFSLDARTGEVIWRNATNLPAWGSPRVEADRVYFGLGNGRLERGAELPEGPAGAVVCLDTATGNQIWRYEISDAVFARPGVDAEHVYFGARDGYCYCLDRGDGVLIWKRDMHSPVLTNVANFEERLYVVASAGEVSCLDASSGRILWSLDVAAVSQTKPMMLSSPVLAVEKEGETTHRFVYFGSELANGINSAAVLYCLED